MANVKRTFSLPAELSTALDATIPNKERSKFIAITLKEALQEKKRNALLALLNATTPTKIPKGKKGVVEALRDMREADFKELQSN